jgi:S1-C subfamily serine protease
MRKVIVLGLLFALSLSAGTILAQDNSTDADTTAWLGVRLVETDDGVVVRWVESDSPAEDGGLLEGDVIVTVDSEAVESADALTELVQSHEPGDVITVTVSRDDTESDLEVELGTAPSRRHDRQDSPFSSEDIDPLVAAERMLRVELTAVDNGYKVLADGMKHGQSELAAGDVITAVNGTPIDEIDWAEQDGTLRLTVQRDGEEITIESASFLGGRGHNEDRGRRQGSPRDNSNDKPSQGHFSA